MRTVALTLAILLAVPICFALDITTRKGVAYKQATVTKVEPDGVRINHSDGAAKISFEELPDTIQRQYNYDPAKLAAYRKQVDDARKAATAKAIEEQLQRQLASEYAEREASEHSQLSSHGQFQFKYLIAGGVILVILIVANEARRQRVAETPRTPSIGCLALIVVGVAWFIVAWVQNVHELNAKRKAETIAEVARLESERKELWARQSMLESDLRDAERNPNDPYRIQQLNKDIEKQRARMEHA